MTWWENTGGDDIVRRRRPLHEAGGSVSGMAADMDGDGDMDILMAKFGSDTLIWWENPVNGPGPVIKVVI